MKFFFSVSSLFFLILNNSTQADEIPLPHAMAALGDSITEGMLTDFSIEQPPNLTQLFYLVSASNVQDRVAYFRKYYARPSHSWAAGNDDSDFVYSHFERLKKQNPKIRMKNFSISGSESSELHRQVDELIAAEREEGLVFDYVVLMTGANDMRRENVSDFVSPMVYEQNVESNIRRILDENPQRQILLVGLPQVHSIFEASANFKAYSILGKFVLCQSLRKDIYGPLVMFKPEEVEGYANSKIIFSLYQTALESLANRLQGEYTNAHLKAVINYVAGRPTRKTLSIDCFHPSGWGQAEIAEKTWRLGFWPQLK